MLKKSMRTIVESYIATMWRVLCNVVSGLARFVTQVVRLALHVACDVLRGLAHIVRALAWMLLALSGVLLAVSVSLYLVLGAVGLSESPAFQDMRELLLQQSLAELREEIAREDAETRIAE